MRKFSCRWWVTPELLQWRYMVECGQYAGPLFLFPWAGSPLSGAPGPEVACGPRGRWKVRTATEIADTLNTQCEGLEATPQEVQDSIDAVENAAAGNPIAALFQGIEPGVPEIIAMRRERIRAAAPDLLAALKRFVDLYPGHRPELNHCAPTCGVCSARAAIAKAEGRGA